MISQLKKIVDVERKKKEKKVEKAAGIDPAAAAAPSQPALPGC